MVNLNFKAIGVFLSALNAVFASPQIMSKRQETCISTDVAKFNPLAVFKDPPSSGPTSAAIAMINVNTIPMISWGIFSAGGSGGWLFYALQGGAIFPKSSIPFPAPVSVALVEGESPLFESIQFPPPKYAGYCSVANPSGGPDLLAASGHSDLWSLCPNNTAGGRNDLVWSPVANHAHYSLSACRAVDIQMIPVP